MSLPILEFDPEVSQSLLQEVMERSDQNLLACYQCRRCAAGCPVGDEAGVTPDRLIRMIHLGERDEALNNLLIWKCVACYICGTRCPNSIQTARINETLKQMAKEIPLEPLVPKIAEFHSAFMVSTSHFGRFNEVECMGIFEARNVVGEMKRGGLKAIFEEMKNQAKLGFAMMKKKRLHLGLKKVRGLPEVKRLYKKAKETKARPSEGKKEY